MTGVKFVAANVRRLILLVGRKSEPHYLGCD
jgi:hypothetical protein